MNQNYFESNEQNDIQLLYEFNEKHRLFDSIKQMKEKSQYDAMATHNKRKFAVEIKKRFFKLNQYKTIMIEDYKYLELLLAYMHDGLEPLYINFLVDGVVIFNLLKLKEKPKFRELAIKSEGYQTNQQKERRYYLYIKDAVIYREDGVVN